jgi:hypothetical protein
LDYVETPSPYLGTEQWYRPQAPVDDVNTPADEAPWFESYRPPFNKLSRFRDPGRINVNTISDPLVWDAIMATYPDFQTTNGSNIFYDLIRARRGYAHGSDNNTGGDIFRTANAFPSIVSNPIRPADSHDLMPLDNMRQLASIPANATLFRTRLGSTNPLFIVADNVTTPYPYLPATPDPELNRATDRNAYFRYQPYAKLANMLTTNSNTFAVWETIGYFEVEANPTGVDIAHPDGYQLGAEMRFEDGGTRRPRAFYIIDRSIPAAFEPGQAHNVERCVLQRRYLE